MGHASVTPLNSFSQWFFSPHVTHSTLLQEEFLLNTNDNNADTQDIFILLIKNLTAYLYKSQ